MTTSPAAPVAEGFPVVTMVGGGQLARMTQQAAIALGVSLRVLSAEPGDSAAQVVRDVRIGFHDDLDALRDAAAGAAVVTFDHEHVPQDHLTALEADGVLLRPRRSALRHAQDKAVMRQRLSELGIPCPRWRLVDGEKSLAAFGDDVGWPVVLKTPRGGYDGKGVTLVQGADDPGIAQEWLARGATLLAEERVSFTRELAALVARSPHGQVAVYPVVETVQHDGVCREVVAPAPGLAPDRAHAAQQAAVSIATELDVTGVLAVELFDTSDGVLVNELAMRPHNSGHWSIDGAVTSQFEQHLRAVLDLPLGDPTMTARFAVMANVLGGEHPDMYRAYLHCMARDPGLRIHMYGKAVRPGRKVGHVTVTGDNLEELRARARHAAAYLTGEIDE